MRPAGKIDQNTTGIAPFGRSEWRRMTRRQARGTARLVGIAALFGLALIVDQTMPAFSQGVSLLKVDVAVVANGYRVSKLLGSSVTNDKKEKVGTLDDVIIDRNRKLYAVLEVGGFLGINARLVAVPYESLAIDETGKTIVLPGASRDELKQLAEFKYRR
jgi:sporulation protein YlmC with PRC-barrel domain